MKKMFVALIITFALLLFSACTQFEVSEVSEIRLISREEGVKAVLYPQDEDYKTLIETCTGNIDTEIPACPFGISEIQFVSDEKTVSIYPTGDQCSRFALGEINLGEERSIVNVSTEKMEIIYAILQKYGIQTEGA
jgi:hypothetical protein